MASGKLAQQDSRAVAILAEMLEDRTERNEPYVSHGAIIEALGEMGPAAKDAVPQVLRFLARADVPFFRDEAERVGTVIGKIGPEAVNQLAELLTARRRDLNLRAIDAFYAMGPAAEAAVPQMAEFLAKDDAFQNPDEAVRFMETLGRLGTKAKVAAEPLAKTTLRMDKQIDDALAKNPEYGVSIHAIELIHFAEAWWRIDADQRALQVLVKQLRSDSSITRAFVTASIYHHVEHPPASVIEPMRLLLSQRTAEYETRGERANGVRISYNNCPEPPSPNDTARMALYILSRLEQDAKSALDVIKLIAAEDYEPDVVLAGAFAWHKLEPGEAPTKAAARCLTPERFPGQNPAFGHVTIYNTVLRLDEMGTHAKVVVPQLVSAYKQCSDADTKAAIAALVKKLDAKAAATAGID
jgi:hypothetical protein